MHGDVVDALLCGGADVNKANNDGVTLVLMPSQNGHVVALSELHAAGGDISRTLPDKGASALWAAALSACRSF